MLVYMSDRCHNGMSENQFLLNNMSDNGAEKELC